MLLPELSAASGVLPVEFFSHTAFNDSISPDPPPWPRLDATHFALSASIDIVDGSITPDPPPSPPSKLIATSMADLPTSLASPIMATAIAPDPPTSPPSK